ncbi:hypothetical protein KS4_04590 [Poriferisphaera corsica]|uniref:Uncharacterized protein n=1 Tax=Poriferisphaera corsica TaxID=2528020 RepID=A0A517YQD0_9BACT|nr:hypothetical protein [Poriferisphaera corsica]QDU32427.1 hypothetical protein KS4_04590 [Poriferisphaera corsica]
MGKMQWLQKLWAAGGVAEAGGVDLDAFYHDKIKAMGKLLGHRQPFVFKDLLKDGKIEVREFEGKLTGTTMATVQMIGPDGSGPLPNKLGTYELVMFTKIKRPEGFVIRYNANDVTEFDRSYFKLYLTLRDIMDKVAKLAKDEVIQPKDALDISCEVTGRTYHCVFDELKFKRNHFEFEGQDHGLLLCVLVFESEYIFAKNNGVRALMNEFKKSEIYPYSTLKRKPVI